MSGVLDRVQHLPQQAKVAVDLASGATIVATLMEWMPAVAAALSIVWTLIRIWETTTVQDWWSRRKKGPEPPA